MLDLVQLMDDNEYFALKVFIRCPTLDVLTTPTTKTPSKEFKVMRNPIF